MNRKNLLGAASGSGKNCLEFSAGGDYPRHIPGCRGKAGRGSAGRLIQIFATAASRPRRVLFERICGFLLVFFFFFHFCENGVSHLF
jgi:hypothetical protein